MSHVKRTTLRLTAVVGVILILAGTGWLVFQPRRTILIFSTGSVNGLYHRLALQLKAAIESECPDLTIQLENSYGSNENLQRLDQRRCDLALVQNDGIGGDGVRSIAALYPEVLHFICRRDAAIGSLQDLSEHRTNIGASGSGTYQLTQSLLEFAGVEIAETLRSKYSFDTAKVRLENGDLDAGFFLVGIGSSVVTELLTTDAMRLLPISAGADSTAEPGMFVQGFRVHYPNVTADSIPMMAYRGHPAMPVPTLSVQAVLVCQNDLPSDVIRRVARTLFERRAVLARNEPTFSLLDERSATRGLQFPLHRGADAFYRRQEPSFLSEHAEAMGFIVTLLLVLWSGLGWMRSWVLQRRKNYIDTFYNEISEFLRRLPEISDISEFNELANDLRLLDRRAAEELVKERLDSNDSYLIYQNMSDMCRDAINESRQAFSKDSLHH